MPAPVTRVLQVHTRYRQAGGEDQVVAAEQRLLAGAGIEVRQVIFDNADLREPGTVVDNLHLAAGTIWSAEARSRVARELESFRPDVMHVHNTFAAASPSVYAPAAAAGVPVVQTLHNYRLVCPAAIPFRDGHACTDCVGLPVPLPGVIHGCVRGSRAQSAVVVAMLTSHRAIGTWRHRIAAYIALTDFQRRLLVRGGVPGARIRVVPNFLEPDPGTGPGERSGLLFAGRLSVEKGIVPLLGAAHQEPGILQIAGTGPLDSLVRAAAAAGDLERLGQLDAPTVRERMQRSIAVVLPSINFEGFPITLVEAFATGTPVIAARIGSLGELVQEGVTGLFVEPNDATDLAGRMRWSLDHPAEMREMGSSARARYEAAYRGSAHLQALIDTYGAVVRRRPAPASEAAS